MLFHVDVACRFSKMEIWKSSWKRQKRLPKKNVYSKVSLKNLEGWLLHQIQHNYLVLHLTECQLRILLSRKTARGAIYFCIVKRYQRWVESSFRWIFSILISGRISVFMSVRIGTNWNTHHQTSFLLLSSGSYMEKQKRVYEKRICTRWLAILRIGTMSEIP